MRFLLIVLLIFLLETRSCVLDKTSPKKQCETRAEKLKFVTVHVTGKTEAGLKIQSTHDNGVPMEFQLGIGMVFFGLDEGIEGMCLGEKRLLNIPPENAYKKRGKQKPELPADEKLIYEVELLNVSEYVTMAAFRWLDINRDEKLSENEAMELIEMTFESSVQFPGIDAKKMTEMYMNMHDTNKDGFISAEEYQASSEKAHRAKLELQNQGAFKASSKDKKLQHKKDKNIGESNKDEL